MVDIAQPTLSYLVRLLTAHDASWDAYFLGSASLSALEDPAARTLAVGSD